MATIRRLTIHEVAEGLGRTDLVVSYKVFMNDTARRFADIILPGTVRVTDQLPAGIAWMCSGWVGLNNLTSGQAVAVDMFGFSAGQASFEAMVEVIPQ